MQPSRRSVTPARAGPAPDRPGRRRSAPASAPRRRPGRAGGSPRAPRGAPRSCARSCATARSRSGTWPPGRRRSCRRAGAKTRLWLAARISRWKARSALQQASRSPGRLRIMPSSAASIRARSAAVARSAAMAAAAGSTTRRASRSERTRVGIEGAPLALPGEQLGVEQVPAVAARTTMPSRGRASIRPLAARKRTASRKRGPADLEALAQLGLVRQAAARRPGPLEDAQAQAPDHARDGRRRGAGRPVMPRRPAAAGAPGSSPRRSAGHPWRSAGRRSARWSGSGRC